MKGIHLVCAPVVPICGIGSGLAKAFCLTLVCVAAFQTSTKVVVAESKFRPIAWTRAETTYPVWNFRDQVAYRGFGFDGSNEIGIWSGGGDQGPELVARVGAPAPGTDEDFDYFSPPVLNSNGQTAFSAFLTGAAPRTLDWGIWTDGGGNGLRLVVRDNLTAPGTEPGVSFNLDGSSSSGPRLDDSGRIAFRSSLQGPGINSTNDAGIWSEARGNGLELVAREGDVAPGTTATFGSFLPPDSGLGLNNSGQTAFLASLAGPEINSTNDVGIWAEGSGNGLELIAREGNLAPGTNAYFSRFLVIGAPAMNDIGQVAFFGQLTGPGVNSTNERGIWSGGGGNGLQLVVRNGDPTPGSNGTYFDRVNFPQINADGQVVFASSLAGAQITSSNAESIWRTDATNVLQLVAQSGASAPGTNAIFGRVYGPGINESGRVGFAGTLIGQGVDNTNDFGFWAEDKFGNIQLVVREGDIINVSADPSAADFREIELVAFNGTLSGKGEAYFFARFTDGSEGVFAARLTLVPEPNSLVLLVVAYFTLHTARQNRR